MTAPTKIDWEALEATPEWRSYEEAIRKWVEQNIKPRPRT